MELDCRSIGDFAEPDVEILALASLEKEDVVAVVQFGELVQLVEARLGVELGVLSAVREHGGDIV